MRLSNIIKGLVGLCVVAIVALGAVLYSTDFNQYKREFSIPVKALTDRKHVLGGKLKLTFVLRPAIAVDKVTFFKAKCGSRADMLRIKKLRVELRLIPLLFGNIRIKQIVLSGADILLETGADGVGNWNLQPSAKDKTDPGTVPTNLTFDKILIKNSVLVWWDRRTGDKKTIKINLLRTRAAAATAPLKLDLKEFYSGRRVKLDVNIDSLNRLTSNKPTSFQLTLYTSGTKIKAQGKIRGPMNGTGVKVSLNVAGENFATLSGLAGTALPAIEPYDFAATIVDRKSRWHLKQVKPTVGKPNLRSDVYIDPNTAPVRIVARLQSALVRAVDFEKNVHPENVAVQRGGRI